MSDVRFLVIPLWPFVAAALGGAVLALACIAAARRSRGWRRRAWQLATACGVTVMVAGVLALAIV